MVKRKTIDFGNSIPIMRFATQAMPNMKSISATCFVRPLAIVCVADQLIEKGETQTRKLATVSQVFDESATSDERRFIRCIEEQRGKPGHHLREDDYRLLMPPTNQSKGRTLNSLLFASEYHRGMCEAMHKDQARVLLSGQGGDEMLSGNRDPSPELADLLFQGRLLDLNRS